MEQHWTVFFTQDILPYMDDIIRIDAKKEPIKRRVMELAERYAIDDYRFTSRFPIGYDVSCLKKLIMP